MFEKDISQLAKPKIKGRGFIGSGTEIIETQTYYTAPDKDWVFDEDQRLTYDNPEYKKQCKRLGKEPDTTGFVDQIPLDEIQDDSKDDDEDKDKDDDDDFDDFDEDFDEEFGDEPVFDFSSKPREGVGGPPKSAPSGPKQKPEDKSSGPMSRPDSPPNFAKPVENKKEDGPVSLFSSIETPKAPESKVEGPKVEAKSEESVPVSSFADIKVNPTEEKPSNVSSITGDAVSTADKVREALDLAPDSESRKPKMRLNIDKTALAEKKKKQGLKLNIKKKES